MPLLSPKEVLNLKLKSIPSKMLKELALNFNKNTKANTSEIIKELLSSKIEEKKVDDFIKIKYNEKIQLRKKLISDEDLKDELNKVSEFSWGVIQGLLDQKIQVEYVRKFFRFDELIKNIESKLHKDIKNYVICFWYNHWTTLLIEEHISSHKKVIPTLKNIKGIDIFFDGQPFDLKITYLPRGYNPFEALKNPKKLATWMYENQGSQRFGSDNRMFVILFDKNNPERSWELKRDLNLVFNRLDYFLSTETVSEKDEIVFNFKRKTYTAVTKILIISK